ncbi:hypothetical protein M878_06325 [Streptomyces roseochromogenus subsp. oscitans DS 12.976]|uniref:Uncharacterized protein n=1 Tax=Streptomyces roseochromogenus subsp. oscitans DS 12.976 TaxID=1352936 RepID=V6KV66_STRRC|nr:hypothetical protein M878_06325 [Streptomyces roseochromogenus subsp. oscitans DS 12.976]
MTGTEPTAPPIDTTRPHPARVYDWFLGGKDNYPVDEELGRRIMAVGRFGDGREIADRPVIGDGIGSGSGVAQYTQRAVHPPRGASTPAPRSPPAR